MCIRDSIRLAQEKAKLAASRGAGGSSLAANLTKGQESADKEFGKDYNEWIQGGFSKVKSNLTVLNDAIGKLKDPKSELGNTAAPGFLRANTPFGLGDYKEGYAIEQQVGSVAVQSLKTVFGGNISDGEREAILSFAYDPQLSDDANIKKVEATMSRIKDAAQAKQEAIEHFRVHGTIKGFRGSDANSISEYMEELKKQVIPTGGSSRSAAEDELRRELGL